MAKNVSFFRCEKPLKCTPKMEGKRANNTPLAFPFSAFSFFSISLNKVSTLPLSFKCSPSSLQLKCPLSLFAFPIKIDLDNLALSTQHFCGSKELLLRWNVAPFTTEKEWFCRDFCTAKRSGTSPLDKEEREKWKEKEYFLKKIKRAKTEKRQPCK